jgi:hypothetical protein
MYVAAGKIPHKSLVPVNKATPIYVPEFNNYDSDISEILPNLGISRNFAAQYFTPTLQTSSATGRPQHLQHPKVLYLTSQLDNTACCGNGGWHLLFGRKF